MPRRGSTGRMDAALVQAEARCRARGESWTAPRRRTYQLLLDAERPVKAYDIIATYGGETATKPPTVYRALDFLISMGLAHRVESQNAYVACIHPDEMHPTQLLLCEGCGRADELVADVSEDTRQLADEAGFEVRSLLVELRGLCGGCQGGPPGA